MNSNIKNKIKYFIVSFVFLFSLFSSTAFADMSDFNDFYFYIDSDIGSKTSGTVFSKGIVDGYGYYSLDTKDIPSLFYSYTDLINYGSTFTFDTPVSPTAIKNSGLYFYFFDLQASISQATLKLCYDGNNDDSCSDLSSASLITPTNKPYTQTRVYKVPLSSFNFGTSSSLINRFSISGHGSGSYTYYRPKIQGAFFSSQDLSSSSYSYYFDFLNDYKSLSLNYSTISPLFPKNQTLTSSPVFTGSYSNNGGYQHLWIKVNDDSPEYCQSISSGSGSYSCDIGSFSSGGSYNTYKVYFSNSMVGLDGSPSSDSFSFAVSSVSSYALVSIYSPIDSFRYDSTSSDISETAVHSITVNVDKSSSSSLDYLYLTTSTYPNGNMSVSEPIYTQVFSCGFVSDSSTTNCDVLIHNNTVTKITAVLSDSLMGINDSSKVSSRSISVLSGPDLFIYNLDTNLDGVIDSNDSTTTLVCNLANLGNCFYIIKESISNFLSGIINSITNIFVDKNDYSPVTTVIDSSTEKPLFQVYNLIITKLSNWNNVSPYGVSWGITIGNRRLNLIGPDMLHGYESQVSILNGFMTTFFWIMLGLAIYGRINRFFGNK